MEQKMQLKILLSLSEDKDLLLHLIPQKKRKLVQTRRCHGMMMKESSDGVQ